MSHGERARASSNTSGDASTGLGVARIARGVASLRMVTASDSSSAVGATRVLNPLLAIT